MYIIYDESGIRTGGDVADIDRDGDLDIFAAEMHHGENSDKVAVFGNLNILQNLWTEYIIATTGSHNAKVSDLDGDGYPDIVGKNYEAGEIPLCIDIWKNNIANSPFAVNHWRRHIIDEQRGSLALFVDSGDLNGDSLLDIVSGDSWYENPGKVDAPWIRNSIGGMLYQMAIVYDFDGDGDLDILGTKGQFKSEEFLWARNNGNGKSWARCVIDIGMEHHDGTQFVDIDNDGDLDIISIGYHHNKVILYENLAKLYLND